MYGRTCRIRWQNEKYEDDSIASDGESSNSYQDSNQGLKYSSPDNFKDSENKDSTDHDLYSSQNDTQGEDQDYGYGEYHDFEFDYTGYGDGFYGDDIYDQPETEVDGGDSESVVDEPTPEKCILQK